MVLHISEDTVSGSAVVAESGDEFLDANAFITYSFENNDKMLPKSLKFSLLREGNSEGRKIG